LKLNTNLVYFHTGKKFPNYLFDSIYQTRIFNPDVEIWIITDLKWISYIYNNISNFNIKNHEKGGQPPTIKPNVNFMSIENLNLLDENVHMIPRAMHTFDKTPEFRNGFWRNTLLRFYYIAILIKYLNLTKVFHIENDVMLYKNLSEINVTNKLMAVQDSSLRAICSIVYIPNILEITNFLTFIKKQTLNFTKFINDMDLMGQYTVKDTFNSSKIGELLFDGAAIGQFLGGIDLANTNTPLLSISKPNPTIGFINETADFKPNKYTFFKCNNAIGQKIFKCKNSDKISDIVNLHIHSKRLWEFSSVFNYKFSDIISGESVMENCDIIFASTENFNYHNNFLEELQSKNKEIKIVRIKDYNLNSDKLKLIENLLNIKKKISIFVYSNYLFIWFKNIFSKLKLKEDIIVDIYSCNSDENIDEKYLQFLKNKSLNKLFVQNLNIQDPKAILLPIGLANKQWSHGNKDLLYKKMVETYKYKKTKNLYINFNENTFGYRKDIKKFLIQNNFEISNSDKSFQDYIEELSKHRYALVPRGNGLDTHRFWECIYLGVIPIVICNEFTNNINFCENLYKTSNLVQIKDLNELKKFK
jgi:hypothetical protein